MNLNACNTVPTRAETGRWYRAIEYQYLDRVLNTDHTRSIFSRFSPGNYAHQPYRILYLGENPLVTLLEVGSWLALPTGGLTPNLNTGWIIVYIDVQLRSIVDLTDQATLNQIDVSAQELTGDWRAYRGRNRHTPASTPIGLSPTQKLGGALCNRNGCEGFITYSAKQPTHRTLIVFPDKLNRTSNSSIDRKSVV